ncbi:hypothetical protein [uncultured Draconibacterium sp.]|uniref:hypothetical protein n=1 Tax=uncultured Draconibacterium sp. TaxID=1573823 RepID=UPI0032162973
MKILTTPIRYLLLVIVALLLSSYGNKKSHPHINEMIVEGFAKRYVMFDYNPPRFKNYKFHLNIKKYKGNYISKSGLFHPNDYSGFTADQKSMADDMVKTMLEGAMPISSTYEEKEGAFTAQGWIQHGGFSADVPEIHASLRHFYDPTRNENDRYLTDEVNNAAMLKLQSYLINPEINGVDWALGDKAGTGVFEQNYSWENGKKYMKAALEEINPEKRDNYMAKAWRCLGETLHMIADNGCPPHVRNDAHPLGNVDPYEEYIEATDVRLFNTGKIPEEQRKAFVKSETARKIAHELAVFTNENFFSNETISGDSKKLRDVKQIAHPNYVYASPKLQNMVYEDEYYDSQVGENQVFHCTDKWIFSVWNIGRTTAPYIDGKCIQSQAKVLVPTIVEAGINVMKLYIPELTVKITDIDEDGNVTGFVKHTTDEEYKKTIKYNGLVEIKDNSQNTLARIQAKNGQFSGRVPASKKEIFAEIEFGGVIVCSDNLQSNIGAFGLSSKAKKTAEEMPDPSSDRLNDPLQWLLYFRDVNFTVSGEGVFNTNIPGYVFKRGYDRSGFNSNNGRMLTLGNVSLQGQIDDMKAMFDYMEKGGGSSNGIKVGTMKYNSNGSYSDKEEMYKGSGKTITNRAYSFAISADYDVYIKRDTRKMDAPYVISAQLKEGSQRFSGLPDNLAKIIEDEVIFEINK